MRNTLSPSNDLESCVLSTLAHVALALLLINKANLCEVEEWGKTERKRERRREKRELGEGLPDWLRGSLSAWVRLGHVMFTWMREAKLIFKVNVAKLWKKKDEGKRRGMSKWKREGEVVTMGGMGQKGTREVEVA